MTISTRGRRWSCTKMQRNLFIGIDIGGTKTAVVASCEPPSVLKRFVFPTLPERGPEQTIATIETSIQEILSSLRMKTSDIAAMGVSCGGPLDPIAGVINSPPNLPLWKGIPLRALLERTFAAECFIENDANAGALAEFRFGAGRGHRDLVFLTMGTGLGAGLILNGQLYRGASNTAGEIGHVRLTPDGPEGYGKLGAAEAWASGAGMAKVAELLLKKANESGVLSTLAAPNVRLTAHDIWQAAQAGDLVAKDIVRCCGTKLGEAIAILVDILNPEKVIIGGLALRMGEQLLAPARKAMRSESLSAAHSVCDVVSAELGEAIGDVAALCVALQGHQKLAPVASS